MMRCELKTVGIVAAMLLATVAHAEEGGVPLRSFDRFELDTGTAHRLWLEVGSALAHTDRTVPPFGVHVSADTVTTLIRFAYGTEHLEAGLLVPHVRVDQEVSSPNLFGSFSGQRNEHGIGDIRLYGKAIPLRSKWVDAGFGIELTLPSGDQNKGLGAGEAGVLPYGTAAVHAGPVDVRAHFGHLWFLGHSSNGFSSFQPFDLWIYGGGLHAALGDYCAVRAEFIGESLDSDRARADAVLFEPGVDVRLPLTGIDILLRPTGAIGITDDSPDWGVGGSVVLAWPSTVAP